MTELATKQYKKLSDEEVHFCKLLRLGESQFQAYVKAFKCTDKPDNYIKTTCHRKFKQAHIQHYIKATEGKEDRIYVKDLMIRKGDKWSKDDKIEQLKSMLSRVELSISRSENSENGINTRLVDSWVKVMTLAAQLESQLTQKVDVTVTDKVSYNFHVDRLPKIINQADQAVIEHEKLD